jgi:hypothetical protein
MHMPSRRRGRAAVRSLAFLATAGAVVALAAAPAAANMAAPPSPARVSGLLSAGGPSPLEVKDAALIIDCSSGPDDCRMRVTYRLHNPGRAPAGGLAAFYALDTDDVAVTVDGQPADHRLGAADASAFDDAVAAASGDASPDLSRDQGELSRHGVELSLAAGATAEVVITGVITPTSRRRYYLGVPAAPARHRLLVHGGKRDRRVGLRYFVAPIRTWSGFPAQMSFTLIHPARWQASVDGVAGDAISQRGGVTTHQARIATDQPMLSIELELSSRSPIHAGHLLGVGGNVDDAVGVRWRAGVEAGRGAYLASLAVELEGATDDTDSGVVLVPAVTAAGPWIFVIPSVGLGLGVPVRLAPTTAIGARFTADAHFGPLGMLLALDYFPGMDADPRRFTVALLGQLAL